MTTNQFKKIAIVLIALHAHFSRAESPKKDLSLDTCRKKFINMGYKIATKINELNASKSPLSVQITGLTFLKALNANDIVNVDDTMPLNYKNEPVEVLYQDSQFKVRCSAVLNASDSYLFGLVAHEIFRKIDKTNNTNYEGDQYGLSRQLSADFLETNTSFASAYTPLQQVALKNGFTKYSNSCSALLMSPQGQLFDRVFKITEYKKSTKEVMTIYSDEQSLPNGKEQKNLNFLSTTIRQLFKKGNPLFNRLTQFSRRQEIQIVKLNIDEYRHQYNLNDDIYLECENSL